MPILQKKELSPHFAPKNTDGQYGLTKVFPYDSSFLPVRVLNNLSPLAGSIPGPIAFGWVIDNACLVWQDQCGHQGSCFVYQNATMSRYMLIAGLPFKVSWLEKSSATVPLSFPTHCFPTILLPRPPSYLVLHEGTAVGLGPP